jgi:hypothetical protein
MSEDMPTCELCGEAFTPNGDGVIEMNWGDVDEYGNFFTSSSTLWHEDCFDLYYRRGKN